MRHWSDRADAALDIAGRILIVAWFVGMVAVVPRCASSCQDVSDTRAACAGMCGRLNVDGHEVQYVGDNGVECWCRTSSTTKVRVYTRRSK